MLFFCMLQPNKIYCTLEFPIMPFEGQRLLRKQEDYVCFFTPEPGHEEIPDSAPDIRVAVMFRGAEQVRLEAVLGRWS